MNECCRNMVFLPPCEMSNKRDGIAFLRPKSLHSIIKLKIPVQITFLVSNYRPIMTALAPFKLSPQKPESSTYSQLKIWIEELSSYEHELTMKIASLSQILRKQCTPAVGVMMRHYRTLLSDIRRIKEMFEGQKYDIASDESSERPSKRAAR